MHYRTLKLWRDTYILCSKTLSDFSKKVTGNVWNPSELYFHQIKKTQYSTVFHILQLQKQQVFIQKKLLAFKITVFVKWQKKEHSWTYSVQKILSFLRIDENLHSGNWEISDNCLASNYNSVCDHISNWLENNLNRLLWVNT